GQEGRLDETFRRQFRPIEIPAGYSPSANPNLPGHPNGYRVELGVQNVNLGIGNWPADRNPACPTLISLDLIPRRECGRLCGAIDMQEPLGGAVLQDFPHRAGIAFFASKE